MDYLQNLWRRSEGFEFYEEYDSILSRFRCIQTNIPPPDEVNSRLTNCSFAKKPKHGHILVTACEDGQLIILNTAHHSNQYKIHRAHNQMIFSVAWSDIDMKLITTSGDLRACLWSVHDGGTITKIDSFKAHTSSVKTACFKPMNSEVFATGGRDSDIFVWDSRNYRDRPEQCIVNGHKESTARNTCITCVLFQDEYKLISCAQEDSHINIWDLRKTYMPMMKKPMPCNRLFSMDKKKSSGYTHMVINKNKTELYANSLNNAVYSYNMTSLKPRFLYNGHFHRRNDIYVKCDLSPDEKYLVSTDSDNKMFIWKTKFQNPIIRLDGDHEGLSGVSWCPEDNLKLATSSDHYSPWIWDISSLSDNPNNELRPEGTATEIAVSKQPNKRKNVTAMVQKMMKNSVINTGIIRMIQLPNAALDGEYQIHSCTKVGNKNNWLTDYNQRVKDSIQKQVRNASPIANKKSTTYKSPDVNGKNKTRVKKRRNSISPNNLNKYFKVSDENHDKSGVKNV